MPDSPVLAVVIPVCNEEKTIVPLLQDWLPLFRNTGMPFRVILIDDGSKDDSLQLLRTLQEKEAALAVYTQPNAGHGPAILRGYRLALDADWVFQIDSDHQLDTAAFRVLWDLRDEYDLLLAERKEKIATLARRCISGVSRAIVHGLYGRAVDDVNTPYRLMRSQRLRAALAEIPADSFAPNVLLTAWFVLKKSRIFTTVTELRKDGAPRQSRMNAYFLRGALRSAFQTLLFRLK